MDILCALICETQNETKNNLVLHSHVLIIMDIYVWLVYKTLPFPHLYQALNASYYSFLGSVALAVV